MMLAQDFASCHVARSTLIMLVVNNVQKLRWPAKSLDLNPINHMLDLLKHKVRAQPLQRNLRELVIYQMCAAILQQYIHRHISSMSTQKLVVDATQGGWTNYLKEIKYDVFWFCSFCFKGVHVNPLILVCSRDKISMKFCFIC